MGEYFAESTAYLYVDEKQFRNQFELAVIILKHCIGSIGREITEYRDHKDIHLLWGHTGDQISRAAAQLGRLSGLLSKRNDASEMESFKASLYQISKDWANLFDRLYTELRRMEDISKKEWPKDIFTNLEIITEDMYHLCRIYPYLDEHGLRLGIN